MIPGSELLKDLRAVLPTGAHAYRLTIRRGKDLSEGVETGDPVIALANLRDLGADAECRVEIAEVAGPDAGGAPVYFTLVPYFRLTRPVAADPIAVTAPADPNGLPVRLMIYDEAERAYVVDYALFGSDFVADAAALPMQHLLRARFYHWSPSEREWRAVGAGRRINGTGRLGRPTVDDDHRRSARRLLARLADVAPVAERSTGRLLEFYDDIDFLTDVAADADDETLIAVLAELAAGASELALRVRFVDFRPDGSKAPGPLVTLSDWNVTFDALARLMQTGAARAGAVRVLELTTRDDGQTLQSVVSALLYRILSEGMCVDPRGWTPDAIDGLCAEWDARPNGSILIGELLNYIQLYAAMRREAMTRELIFDSFFERNHLQECIEPLLAWIETLPAKRRAFYSTRMFRAKLESLRDREAAAALFALALETDSPMKAAATFDAGAETYFSARRLADAWPVIGERRRDLLRQLTVATAPDRDRTSPVLLFSCDVRFLAIYLPHWLSVAEYCKARGLDFHFIVVGQAEALAETFVKVEALRVALAALRGFDSATYADNVTYSTWTTPDWCPEPITFYACARYLALGELTRRLGRDILVQDMDFTLVEDPAAFMTLFPNPGVGIQPSYGLYGIDGWRRFMAGTFYAPNSDGVRESLQALETYLIEGLGVGRSWYLDQNGLAFFFEQAADAGEAMWILKRVRPTQQPKVNKMIEAGQP